MKKKRKIKIGKSIEVNIYHSYGTVSIDEAVDFLNSAKAKGATHLDIIDVCLFSDRIIDSIGVQPVCLEAEGEPPAKKVYSWIANILKKKQDYL